MARRPMTIAGTTVRAAIYCRKSVARGLDQEVNSLTVQRAACEEFCRSQGWTILPIHYDDGGFTGRNTDRPAFQALLADAAAHRFDRVVVYKLDRLSRSLADFVGTVAELERHGAGFVSVTQAFDTASAMGRLTMGILASFASFESDLNSERTKDAIAAAKRGGRFCGGRVPFGYDAVDGRLVVNETEAVVVREVFDLYLTQQSAAGVAQRLNDRGRRTKQGQRWDKGAVLRALRSPAVAGLVGIGGELHAGQHTAIVDRPTWDRVQAILDDRPDQHRPHGRSVEYLLGGLARCAQCGGAYTPASTTKGKRTYHYYRCARRDRSGRDSCPARPLPAKALEDFVVARLRDSVAAGQMVGDIAARLEVRVAEERRLLEDEHRKLPALIAELSAKSAALTDRLMEMEGPGARAVESRLDKHSTRIEEAEARLAEVERRLDALLSAHADAAWVAKALGDFDTVWDHLTPANRQRLVRALVQDVTIDEPTGTITITLVDLVAPEPEAAS